MDTTAADDSELKRRKTIIEDMEIEQGHLALPIHKPLERAGLYTGVSRRRLRNKLKGTQSDAKWEERVKHLTRQMVYDTITCLYLVCKLPSTRTLLKELNMKHFNNDDVLAMRKLLKKFGYTWWRRPESRRAFLIEKRSVLEEKHNYLKNIILHRVLKTTVYFVNEMRIDVDEMTIEPYWQPYSEEKNKKKPQAVLLQMYSSENYRYESTVTNKIVSGPEADLNESGRVFMKWISETLKSMNPNSVVVINNAPHHGTELHPRPTEVSTKREIADWLRVKGVPFDEGMHRSQLLVLANNFHHHKKEYKVDEYIRSKGHEVLRLPDTLYYLTTSSIENIKTYLRVAKYDRSNFVKIIEEAVERMDVAKSKLDSGTAAKEKQYLMADKKIEDSVDIAMHLDMTFNAEVEHLESEFYSSSSEDDD